MTVGKRKLKIGILGCGPIAQLAHLEACQKAENVVLLEHVHFNMSCCGLASQPLEIPIEITTQVKTAANENSISIIGLSSTFNMIHPDSKVRDEGIKSLEVLASCCSSLGTRFISLCSGTRDPINKWKWHPENASAASWKQLLQILEKAVTIAEKYQVYLGIEPEEAVDLLNNNIWMAHAKDRDLMGNIRAPGKGDIDFRFYISKLKGNRFQWLFGNAWT